MIQFGHPVLYHSIFSTQVTKVPAQLKPMWSKCFNLDLALIIMMKNISVSYPYKQGGSCE